MNRQDSMQVNLPLSVTEGNIEKVAFDCPAECQYGMGSVNYGDHYCKWCGQRLSWDTVNEYIGKDAEPANLSAKGTDTIAHVMPSINFEAGTPAKLTGAWEDGYAGDPAVNYIALSCPTSGCKFCVELEAYNFDEYGEADDVLCQNSYFVHNGKTIDIEFETDGKDAAEWMGEFYCPNCGQLLDMASVDEGFIIDVD